MDLLGKIYEKLFATSSAEVNSPEPLKSESAVSKNASAATEIIRGLDKGSKYGFQAADAPAVPQEDLHEVLDALGGYIAHCLGAESKIERSNDPDDPSWKEWGRLVEARRNAFALLARIDHKRTALGSAFSELVGSPCPDAIYINPNDIAHIYQMIVKAGALSSVSTLAAIRYIDLDIDIGPCRGKVCQGEDRCELVSALSGRPASEIADVLTDELDRAEAKLPAEAGISAVLHIYYMAETLQCTAILPRLRPYLDKTDRYLLRLRDCAVRVLGRMCDAGSKEKLLALYQAERRTDADRDTLDPYVTALSQLGCRDILPDVMATAHYDFASMLAFARLDPNEFLRRAPDWLSTEGISSNYCMRVLTTLEFDGSRERCVDALVSLLEAAEDKWSVAVTLEKLGWEPTPSTAGVHYLARRGSLANLPEFLVDAVIEEPELFYHIKDAARRLIVPLVNARTIRGLYAALLLARRVESIHDIHNPLINVDLEDTEYQEAVIRSIDRVDQGFLEQAISLIEHEVVFKNYYSAGAINDPDVLAVEQVKFDLSAISLAILRKLAATS